MLSQDLRYLSRESIEQLSNPQASSPVSVREPIAVPQQTPKTVKVMSLRRESLCFLRWLTLGLRLSGLLSAIGLIIAIAFTEEVHKAAIAIVSLRSVVH